MKALLISSVALFLFVCGCGRQAVTPVTAAASQNVSAIAQLEIRPAEFLEQAAEATSGAEPNKIRWNINIAESSEDKIEELGLKRLFEVQGEKNSLIREEIGRSPIVQLARGATNVLLNLRAGTYAGICSADAASNIVDRATRISGVDLLSFPPVFTGGTNEARAIVGNAITVVLTTAKNGQATEFSTNLTVGPTVTLRVRGASGDALQLEAIARVDQFLGYARDEKHIELKPPSPMFDVSIVGTRTELPIGHALLLGGPMEMRVRRTIERVPTLSDIPLVGRIFTKKQVETNFVRQVVIIRRVPE